MNGGMGCQLKVGCRLLTGLFPPCFLDDYRVLAYDLIEVELQNGILTCWFLFAKVYRS
jgi:hypothetical protein